MKVQNLSKKRFFEVCPGFLGLIGSSFGCPNLSILVYVIQEDVWPCFILDMLRVNFLETINGDYYRNVTSGMHMDFGKFDLDFGLRFLLNIFTRTIRGGVLWFLGSFPVIFFAVFQLRCRFLGHDFRLWVFFSPFTRNVIVLIN